MAVEILITSSYSTGVNIFYRGLTEVFIASPFCDYVHEGQVKRILTICHESVVNHDECRHSIVNYHNPYHWLQENYEFRTTFQTKRIQGNESRNCINDHVGKKATHALPRTFCVLSLWLQMGFTADVGK